jgi:hypothetical protein
MPKNLSFDFLSSTGHRYRYGLEILYRERHLPTLLSIFFCSIKHKKVEGKGWVVDNHKTYCYDFDCRSGSLQYVSQHEGDFTKPGFRWSDSRIAQFEQDALTKEHYRAAQNTAQRAYGRLEELKEKADDPKWDEEHEPFMSLLEKIVDKK